MKYINDNIEKLINVYATSKDPPVAAFFTLLFLFMLKLSLYALPIILILFYLFTKGVTK